jgi:hypothetical protein
MTIALLLAGQVLHADDKPSEPADSRLVPIKMGDKTAYIRVKKQHDPYANLSPSQRSFFSKESPLANKQFYSNDAPVTKNNSSLQQQTFLTKSYYIDSQSQSNTIIPNLNTKVSTDAATAYGRNAFGFDKSFAASKSNSDQGKKALLASNTSEYQGRTATMGPQQMDAPSASPLAGKSYQGPETASARHDLDQVNSGLSRMSDLPNRALTIDEVRNLINHDTKPDSKAKPEPASKPLNDPDYKPVPSPAPPAADDDRNDLIPSPGMAAAAVVPPPPENSEPLPK